MSTPRASSTPVTAAIAATLAALALAAPAAAAELRVVAVSPAPSALHSPRDGAIVVEFDRPVDRASVTPASFWAFARWSGTVSGSHAYALADRRVTLVPARPFSAGETVTVFLAGSLRAADGSAFRAAGHSWQFWTAAGRSRRVYREIDRQTTRSNPGTPTVAYGGIGSDLDGDGFLDVTIVNEDTRDLRVFLNRGDGSGLFAPFIDPGFRVGNGASPSEPADFDRDGDVDIAVTDPEDDTVSVLLGVGDGSFAPRQVIAVGGAPRGIAVLDVDGDGDQDLVNANSSQPGPALSLMLNDGNGVFGAATFLPAGVGVPWPLSAADMDHDGRLDLVVGGQGPEEVAVLRATAPGSFAVSSIQPSGGQSWMLMCGDVDGDGDEDVSIVLGGSAAGAILDGDGAGGIAAPTLYPLGGLGTATDLGDSDGDGDLDWATSSYSGRWELYVNDAGTFTFDQGWPATSAGSCALQIDFENDGDLDLVLVDELADEVVFEQNSGICGDGVTEDEDCDDGAETANCDADCTLVACGDGRLNRAAGESCDDGNRAAGDGCDGGCQPEPACTPVNLGRVQGLYAVIGPTRDAMDVTWTLDVSPAATGHHLNSIADDKRELADPSRESFRVVSECTLALPGDRCSVTGARTTPGITYYQVLSACRGGGPEGPA